MLRRTLSGLLAVSFWAALAIAQQETPEKKEEGKQEEKQAEPVKSEKAVEILKKADDLTKKVTSVHYKGTFKATGRVGQMRPEAEFDACLSGEWGTPSFKYRTTIKYKQPGATETEEFTVGSDGQTYYLIDPKEKKVYEDVDPAVHGRRGQLAQGVLMIEYVHASPFTDELKGRVIEYAGTEKVGDEECHKIRINYSSQATQWATWYFSTKDNLPRRVDREFTGGQGGGGGTQQILTEVNVDPKFDKDPFVSSVPEGFTKTDDFAP